MPLASKAKLGRGIWGKGMGRDEWEAGRAGRPGNGRIVARHEALADRTVSSMPRWGTEPLGAESGGRIRWRGLAPG